MFQKILIQTTLELPFGQNFEFSSFAAQFEAKLRNYIRSFRATGNFQNYSLKSGCDETGLACQLFGETNKWEENVEENQIENGQCRDKQDFNFCCCGTDLCNFASTYRRIIVFSVIFTIKYFW